MACCDILFCFSGDPVENDPRAQYHNVFKVNMLQAPFEEPAWFCYSCLCLPCSQYQLRQQVLGSDWPQHYSCCQSYLTCCNMNPGGQLGEQSFPELCLCCEVVCCPGCAVSATRASFLDKYNLLPDPVDNKIVRFNNWVQLLTVLVDCLSICVEGLKDAKDVIRLVANLVFHCTVGCMSAQMHYELFRGGPPGSGLREGATGAAAPLAYEEMSRD